MIFFLRLEFIHRTAQTVTEPLYKEPRLNQIPRCNEI